VVLPGTQIVTDVNSVLTLEFEGPASTITLAVLLVGGGGGGGPPPPPALLPPPPPQANADRHRTAPSPNLNARIETISVSLRY
jgi:hypothetical protein